MGNQMNPSREEEIHVLLGRVSERTLNIWRVVEKIEKHQETQNDHIQTALVNSRVNRILIGIGGSVLVLIIAALITNARGVW